MFDHSKQQVAEAVRQYVQQAMPPDPTGHDWPHVNRVLKNALLIAKKEGGDLYQVTLIALTHDLFDHKFFAGTQDEAKIQLALLLQQKGADETTIGQVVENVFSLSYSKSATKPVLSPEGKMVQDADRLEAIGAIGIARAFAYGGYKNRLMNHGETPESGGTTFDHFFEKLLKLYDLLNTTTAREMARERFVFMEEFVKRFEAEWNLFP